MYMPPPLWQKAKNSLLMKVKEESEKTNLKPNIKKTNIVASGPITSRQIEGGKVEAGTDFIFLGSKIISDSGSAKKLKDACSLEAMTKAMTNLDSIFKSRIITLLIKVCTAKAMALPVVIYECKSWTIKMAEC